MKAYFKIRFQDRDGVRYENGDIVEVINIHEFLGKELYTIMFDNGIKFDVEKDRLEFIQE